MIDKKILGFIGLAARARKVSFGADSVELQIKKRKSHIVIISNEASNRSCEKFIKLCEENNISYIIGGNIEELSKAIGKVNKAIISVDDINMAKQIKKINNGGEIIG